ncbi:uncharacterized protein MELLADRAFT_110143 [Melampsora larici-populina 98AG31]|uniref:Uncharacterized protein n=1 Tax=Melampsora larici-populina (strain 98AG31 / pathotype 3-4-7) TaxID=747676 RepID=F4RYT4_MELLP|nr:uncharacterized protein MELLADRAFT_110143 [Melampsora larici-populina 98AG31]EGG02303.1 hypothetical protein MELLADRAFT_110143 [Melampsora larici-populina 98AG31]
MLSNPCRHAVTPTTDKTPLRQSQSITPGPSLSTAKTSRTVILDTNTVAAEQPETSGNVHTYFEKGKWKANPVNSNVQNNNTSISNSELADIIQRKRCNGEMLTRQELFAKLTSDRNTMVKKVQPAQTLTISRNRR